MSEPQIITCAVCGAPKHWSGKGRKAMYCSEKCKIEAFQAKLKALKPPKSSTKLPPNLSSELTKYPDPKTLPKFGEPGHENFDHSKYCRSPNTERFKELFPIDTYFLPMDHHIKNFRGMPIPKDMTPHMEIYLPRPEDKFQTNPPKDTPIDDSPPPF